MNYKNFKNRVEMNDALASKLASDIQKTLEQKKEIWFVVSGGKTPIELFKNLSHKNIDWKRVNITLVDERCVPVDDERSNEGMVRKYLIKNKALKANFYGLNIDIKSSMGFLNKINEIDILVLGMGSDGHTASFFSKDSDLVNILNINNKKLFSTVSLSAESYKRVTLNYNVLSKAKNIYLNITGSDKKTKLEYAAKEKNIMETPISIFLDHAIDIYWSP